jgi:hypothetical protein
MFASDWLVSVTWAMAETMSPGPRHVDVHYVTERLGRDLVPRLGSRDPGVRDDDVESPKGGHARMDGLAEPLVVARVDHRGDDPSAGGLHQADRLVEVFRTRRVVRHAVGQLARDVDRDDVRALGRHPDRMRATLPPGRPRDECDLALEPTRH